MAEIFRGIFPAPVDIRLHPDRTVTELNGLLDFVLEEER
jgi:hypothetical protein